MADNLVDSEYYKQNKEGYHPRGQAGFFPQEAGYYEQNKVEYNRGQQGIFALHPLMSPKYAIGPARDSEYRETMARMYLSLAGLSEDLIKQYKKSIPKGAVQALYDVLTSHTGFIDFLLSDVRESFSEKLQVDEVLSDNYVAFYFGQAPPVFQFTGYLINSQQDDQRLGWIQAYQHLLRGHALAKRRGHIRVRYDSIIVSGTVNDTSQAIQAGNELVVPFSFSILVKEYLVLRQTRFQKLDMKDFIKLETVFDPTATDEGQASELIETVIATLPQDASTLEAKISTITAPSTQFVDKPLSDVRGTPPTWIDRIYQPFSVMPPTGVQLLNPPEEP